jgi:hypothetical protein
MKSPTILHALGALLGAGLPLAPAALAQTPAEQALRNSTADMAMAANPGHSTGGIDPAFALLGHLGSAHTKSSPGAAPGPTSPPWPDAHQALLGRSAPYVRPPARQPGA